MSLRARSIALLALLVGVLAVVAAGCGGDDSSSGGGSADNGGKKMYVIGVSNTLVGNGWREEMICSVKAQATYVIGVFENGGRERCGTEGAAPCAADFSRFARALLLPVANGGRFSSRGRGRGGAQELFFPGKPLPTSVFE